MICGKIGMFLAVSIDSLGYYEYYKILYDDIGLMVSSITATYYHQHDKKRRADQLHAKKAARLKILVQ
jgi:hypothetical protein